MQILVVDDEKAQRVIVRDILEDAGYTIDVAENGTQAIRKISSNDFHIILTDLKMPDKDGLEILSYVKNLNPRIQVIIMTAFGTIPGAVDAIKGGAYDYLTKPFKKEDLLRVIGRAAEKAALLTENQRLREEMSQRFSYQNLIGSSASMQRVYRLIERIKDIETTVLITGESGTGKELVAKAIHYSGKRNGGPFVAINCGAIPENLIESELFGHEKGSFTGAYKTYIGKFEQAHTGTIFLDEIGTMRQDLQIRLLRVLQEKKIERVGSNTSIDLDVRVIAASNEDLQEKAQQNKFRLDLFHRLNVFTIHLDSLRQRKSDIPLLAKHFVQKYSKQYNKTEPVLTREALNVLEGYSYPGNVRELENIIEKTIILSEQETITDRELMLPEGSDKAVAQGEYKSMRDQEIYMIKQALVKGKGSIKNAAELLGISYKTLQYRLKKFGIDKNTYK